MTTKTREADVIDAKAIRDKLGTFWGKPQPHGEDSWIIDGTHRRIIVSIDNYTDPDVPWIHASISYLNKSYMPSYQDLKQLHAAVFGDGHAYQCFVPAGEHVDISENVLHLFGRIDGAPVLPDFAPEGTI